MKTTLVLCWGISHYAQILNENALPNPVFVENASSCGDHTPETANLHICSTFWDLAIETKKAIVDRLIENGFTGAKWTSILQRGGAEV